MDVLFRSCVPICGEKEEVLPGFAQQVLDLEIKFNFSSSFKNLSALVALYSQGIEFYESVHSPKFRYYSEKLQNLLKRPESLEAIYERNSPRSQNRPQHLFCDRSSHCAIKKCASNAVQLSTLVKDNLKQQEESLSLRLEKRKKMLQKNRKLEKDEKEEKGEKSEKSEKGEKREHSESHQSEFVSIETFEAEIEGIVDRYAEEKLKVKKEVEEEYENCLNDLSSYSGDVFQELKSEIKKNMMNEISDKLSGLEERKSREISKAREKLWVSVILS
jgi:hypothetical protein